jgi:hypothetical protein
VLAKYESLWSEIRRGKKRRKLQIKSILRRGLPGVKSSKERMRPMPNDLGLHLQRIWSGECLEERWQIWALEHPLLSHQV